MASPLAAIRNPAASGAEPINGAMIRSNISAVMSEDSKLVGARKIKAKILLMIQHAVTSTIVDTPIWYGLYSKTWKNPSPIAAITRPIR